MTFNKSAISTDTENIAYYLEAKREKISKRNKLARWARKLNEKQRENQKEESQDWSCSMLKGQNAPHCVG